MRNMFWKWSDLAKVMWEVQESTRHIALFFWDKLSKATYSVSFLKLHNIHTFNRYLMRFGSRLWTQLYSWKSCWPQRPVFMGGGGAETNWQLHNMGGGQEQTQPTHLILFPALYRISSFNPHKRISIKVGIIITPIYGWGTLLTLVKCFTRDHIKK